MLSLNSGGSSRVRLLEPWDTVFRVDSSEWMCFQCYSLWYDTKHNAVLSGPGNIWQFYGTYHTWLGSCLRPSSGAWPRTEQECDGQRRLPLTVKTTLRKPALPPTYISVLLGLHVGLNARRRRSGHTALVHRVLANCKETWTQSQSSSWSWLPFYRERMTLTESHFMSTAP